MAYRKLEEKLLVLLVVAAPILFWPSSYDEFREVKETFFHIVALGVFICSISEYMLLSSEKRPGFLMEYHDLGAGKYIVALLAISAVAFGISYLLHEHTSHGFRTLMNYMAGIMLFFSFIKIVSVDRGERWLKIFLIPVLLNAVMGIAQYSGHDPFFESLDADFHEVYRKYRVAGFMDSPNMLAPLICSIAPFLFLKTVYARMGKEFISYLLLLAVVLVPLILSENLGGILSLGTIFVFLLIVLSVHLKKGGGLELSKLIVIWILFAVTLLFFTQRLANMDSDSRAIKKWSMLERMSQYQVSYRMFAESPIIGKGPGYFFRHFVEYRRAVWFGNPPPVPVTRSAHQAHNDFLQFLGEGGLLSTIPLLGIIGIILYICFRFLGAYLNEGPPDEKRLVALASFSGFTVLNINALSNFPYHVAPLAVSAIFFGALFLKTARQGDHR